MKVETVAESGGAGQFWDHAGPILGLALSALTLLLIVVTLILTVRNGYALISQAFLFSVAMAAVVGGLLTSRVPRNVVGWLIAGFAICFALGEFSRQYVIYGAFRSAGGLPALALMSIPVYVAWFPGLMMVLVLLPLYFPNGKLPSPAWRPFAWLTVLLLVFISILAVVRPRADEIPGYPNPLGLGLLLTYPSWVQALFNLLEISWLILGIVASSSLLLRYRRAGAQERLQLKWFIYAVAVMLGFSILQRFLQPPMVPEFVSSLTFTFALAGLWLAIAVAVLRYRLYDIDLIIRRTVTYALVTGLLAVVFFGSVVVLQQVFAGLTGAGQNELVTVLSTLAIAALFVPVRNQIQGWIDRRFNRNKYDAQTILTQFAETVRDETDLDRLTARLMQVVDEAMQPESVSVWLKRGSKN